MYQNIPTKVLTCEALLSYAHLSTPYANPSNPTAEPKYSVTILIPKDTPEGQATKSDIDASIQAAYEQGVATKWNGARPSMRNALIYDGDGLRTDGTPYGAECKNHWVLTASSKRKPGVVHISNINAALAPEDIYSGMYGRVTINFFPFSAGVNKGVGCGLGNVLKTRDGEPLSGGASAASDFAGLEDKTAVYRVNPITGEPLPY